MGLGVRAVLKIPRDYLICEYAGDVLPVSYPKDSSYAFQLSYGPKVDQEFEISPQKHWSLSNFVNHGNKKHVNLKTARVLTPGGVVILLITSREVKQGEQLFYCYNGSEKNYETSKFQ